MVQRFKFNHFLANAAPIRVDLPVEKGSTL